jgi:glycosyltransferase involved in cell wall biosynthesis
MATVLWWGRSDPEYSRNRLVLKLFRKLGWQVDFFHPLTSITGGIEAYFKRPARPDLVWVPCFRQTDIPSAAHWAGKWNVPLIADPLISAFQKEVFERQKYPEGSGKANQRLQWEADLFSRTDLVVTDTPAHADFFHDTLGVDKEKLAVLYVGAEEGLFIPCPGRDDSKQFEVLFYGSFLALQGPEVIIEAARLLKHLPIRFTLLGDGDLKPGIIKQAKGLTSVNFTPWIPFEQLPNRLCQADILLGIFGPTPKAKLVIPNKMFQSMAVARPVITMSSNAYPEELLQSDVIGWVASGNPEQLARKVAQFYDSRATLEERGVETRKLFDRFFSEAILEKMLVSILKRVVLP